MVFHFNKGHLADPTIPMWVVKCKGKTYYVYHMESQVGFSTKETPDNDHTKGSLRFKKVDLKIEIIDGQSVAFLLPPTIIDK